MNILFVCNWTNYAICPQAWFENLFFCSLNILTFLEITRYHCKSIRLSWKMTFYFNISFEGKRKLWRTWLRRSLATKSKKPLILEHDGFTRYQYNIKSTFFVISQRCNKCVHIFFFFLSLESYAKAHFLLLISILLHLYIFRNIKDRRKLLKTDFFYLLPDIF